MKVHFKMVVFVDQWLRPSRKRPWPFRWFVAPRPGTPYEFRSFALGFRFEPTPRELRLIDALGLAGEAVLTLRDGDPPLTFFDVLGPELVPEVNPSQTELLRVEARLREAAVIWTRAFESMDGGN